MGGLDEGRRQRQHGRRSEAEANGAGRRLMAAASPPKREEAKPGETNCEKLVTLVHLP
jgi:hypothetical protein